MKKGFGLLEVLIASVVLGFLIVGLMRLQSGNRESILRVRARDAANFIAQEVIDSVSSLGFASVKVGERTGVCPPAAGNEDLCRTRSFKGAGGDMTMNYWVKVKVEEDNSQKVGVGNNSAGNDYLTSDYISATSTDNAALKVQRPFAKRVEVTVNWDFKRTTQSINMSTVIR